MKVSMTIYMMFLGVLNLFGQVDEESLVNSVKVISYESASIPRNQLSAADKDNIMSVGNGYIQKSTDGGKSWITVHSTFTGGFFDIAHPTPIVAIAVGEVGKILRTQDGGKTWEEKSSGATTPLQHIEMFDELHGIIGFVADGTFLLTNDGGNTWVTANIPKEMLPPIFGVVSLIYPFENFIAAHLQWKAENWILTSSDGGQTWTNKKMNLQPRIITAKTKDTLFAGGFEKYNPADQKDIRAYTQIVRSVNGGETWEYLVDTVSADFTGIHKVVFINSSVGIAAGTSESFYFTKDGGNTWIKDNTINSKMPQIKGNEGFGDLTVLSSNLLLSRNPAGVLRVTLNTPTSVADIPLKEIQEIFISPNPANEYINLQTSLPAGDISIRVHSLLGETVAEQFQHNDNEAFSLRLPIENLASGVYFVTLKSEGKSVTRMFVKE